MLPKMQLLNRYAHGLCSMRESLKTSSGCTSEVIFMTSGRVFVWPNNGVLSLVELYLPAVLTGLHALEF